MMDLILIFKIKSIKECLESHMKLNIIIKIILLKKSHLIVKDKNLKLL